MERVEVFRDETNTRKSSVRSDTNSSSTDRLWGQHTLEICYLSCPLKAKQNDSRNKVMRWAKHRHGIESYVIAIDHKK